MGGCQGLDPSWAWQGPVESPRPGIRKMGLNSWLQPHGSGKLLNQSELQFLYPWVATVRPALPVSYDVIGRRLDKGDRSQHQGAPSGPLLWAALQHCKSSTPALWLSGSRRALRLRVPWPRQVGLSCSLQRKPEVGGVGLSPQHSKNIL